MFPPATHEPLSVPPLTFMLPMFPEASKRPVIPPAVAVMSPMLPAEAWTVMPFRDVPEMFPTDPAEMAANARDAPPWTTILEIPNAAPVLMRLPAKFEGAKMLSVVSEFRPEMPFAAMRVALDGFLASLPCQPTLM